MERRLAAVLAADMVGYSRLMERDEAGLLIRQKQHRNDLIDPEIARRRGRVVKSTGDGLLAEFASARDAVRCAIDLQSGMSRREADQPADDRIQYRIGINIGDIIFDDGDIFGDGVNVAARLEALAEPGGICISGSVRETVNDWGDGAFRDMGRQRVKNISRPIRVWQWSEAGSPKRNVPELSLRQSVRFCTSRDGTRIAWARVGEGAPVLRAPHWLNHIEYEWTNPVYGPFLESFAKSVSFVRFDQRCNGLSDWDTERLDPEAMIEDMEAVIEAAGLERFAMFGSSQGAMFSLEFAARYPDRVSCIVLLGGYLRGRLMRDSDEEVQLFQLGRQMIADGWGATNPIFRQFFTSSFVPDATPEEQAAFDELQRLTSDTANALRIFDMSARADVSQNATRVTVPILVVHVDGDRVASRIERQALARVLPQAEFVELPGNNHILTPGTQAFEQFFDMAIPFVNRHT